MSTDEYRIPLHNEKTLETELSGVYVAGVINAGMQTSKLFIENTRVHSRLIVQSILSKKNSVVGVNLG